MNVLVYALPNTTSGGLSVVLNLYEDIKTHRDQFPDIHWYFITGTDGFEDADNITVFNESRALRSYFQRWYFNIVKVRRFVREHDVKAVISLNAAVTGLRTPSIISLHNVLPLFRCDSTVFDSRKDRMKQALRNRIIIKSLKRADYILIPSHWIRHALVTKFGIRDEQIRVSQINTPEMKTLARQCAHSYPSNSESGCKEFIYPATGFPYKNHRVILRATEKLIDDGVRGFRVLLAGNLGNGKTVLSLRDEVQSRQLPIEFCGPYSKQQLSEAYRKGTLLFPSKIETDGFPLLESMACGGYIIASDLDYAREALQGYDNYDLFDPDDAETLAALMRAALQRQKRQSGRSAPSAENPPRTSVIVPLLREIEKRGK